MYKQTIEKLLNKKNLLVEESEMMFNEIFKNNLNPVQISAFLTGLAAKGEIYEEIYGAASSLNRFKVPVHCSSETLADTCGTGGDKSGTFNISTAVAFVIAANGFTVAKHGNRSVTSSSGSADVLISLGINLANLTPEKAEQALNNIGISFLFAPYFHPAMKYVADIRKNLNFRTIFNIIGPLVNPAGPVKFHALGVFSPKLVPVMAKVLQKMGVENGAVFSSYDGLDEISVFDQTKIVFFNNETSEEIIFDPKSSGIYHNPEEINTIKVSNPDESANIIKKVLTNSSPSVARDIVTINAAIFEKLRDPDISFEEAIKKTREIISTYKPLEKLNQLIGFAQKEEAKN